ncbi:MAG: PKD domain-containing protein, partial [Candidatus Hydrogenedens sp.]
MKDLSLIYKMIGKKNSYSFLFSLLIFFFLFICSGFSEVNTGQKTVEKQGILNITQSLSQNPDCAIDSFLDVTVELTYTGEDPLLTLGLREIVPEGLVYEEIISGSAPPLQPSRGAFGTLEFGWIFVPSFPASFTFRLRFAQPISGNQFITGIGIFASFGDPQETEPVISYFDCPTIEGQTEGEGIVEGEGQIEGEGIIEGEGSIETVYLNISSKSGDIYAPEQEMEFEVNISYLNPLEITALGATVFLPEYWQFVKFTAGSPPPIYYFDTETGKAEFAWIFLPSGGITFSFSVLVSPETEGIQEISGYGIYRTTGEPITTTISKIYLTPVPKPDLTLLSGIVTPSNPFSQGIISINYTAKNTGFVNIDNKSWSDCFYLSNDEWLDETDVEITCITNNTSVAVGGQYSNSLKAKLPSSAFGNMYLLAYLNKTKTIYEESRDNNVGVIGIIQIQAREYDFRLTTGITEEDVGTPIPIKIYAYNPETLQPAVNKQIVLQIAHRGFSKTYTFTTDQNGEINYTYFPISNTEGGIYSISIRDPREEDYPITEEVLLRGLAITPSHYFLEVIPNKTYTIPFNIINLGDTEEKQLSFMITGIPPDWNYDYVIPSSIQGQSKETCKLILYSKPTTQNSFPIMLNLQSNSKTLATAQYDILPKPYQTVITSIPEEVSLPLLLEKTQFYTIELKNQGGKDSGPARIQIEPENPNIHLVTPNTVYNIPAGSSYFVSLQVGIPFIEIPEPIETSLSIRFESGLNVSIPIKVIEDTTKSLTINVFNKYTNEAIHNASVSIVSETGILSTSQINNDGIVEVNNLPEPPFSIVILSEGFESQTYFISNLKSNHEMIDIYLEPFLSKQFWSYTIDNNQKLYLLSVSNSSALEPDNTSVLTISPGYIPFITTEISHNSTLSITNQGIKPLYDVYLYPFQTDLLNIQYPVQYLGTIEPQSSINIPVLSQISESFDFDSSCSSSILTGIIFSEQTNNSDISQFMVMPLWNTEVLCPDFTPIYGDFYQINRINPDTTIVPVNIQISLPDNQSNQNVPILSYATGQMTLATGEILPIVMKTATRTGLYEQIDIQWQIHNAENNEDITSLFQIFELSNFEKTDLFNNIEKKQWLLYPLHEFWENPISEIRLFAQIHIISLLGTWDISSPPLPLKILSQPILMEHIFAPQIHELQISSSADNSGETVLPLAILISPTDNINLPIKFEWENIQYLHETGNIASLSLIQTAINGIGTQYQQITYNNISLQKEKTNSYLWYFLSPPLSNKWQLVSRWTYKDNKGTLLPLITREQYHDLLHTIEVTGENASITTGLLSNDDNDEQRIPDIIYLPDGKTLSISTPSNPIWVSINNSHREYGIVYSSSQQSDYVYLHSNFPEDVPEDAVILRILRSDSTVIPSANYWVSKSMNMSHKHDPVKPSLHFVDKSGYNSYIVEFQSESLENKPPIANAGEDITNVYRPSSITLDGSGSYDPNGDRINYSWRLISKPLESFEYLRNADTANPILIPDLPGTYIAQLIVSDGFAQSEPDTVVIEVVNRLPEIVINAQQKARPRDIVVLDASSVVDPDGDEIEFLWKLATKPDGSRVSLQGVFNNTITITPDVLGQYEFILYISDGFDNSFAHWKLDVYNHLPEIAIGFPPTVYLNTNVSISARDTFDIDNDPLSYQWRLVSAPVGSNTILSSFTQPETSFVSDKRGTYTLKLEVFDTYEKTDKTISLQCVNRKPQTIVNPSAIEVPHGKTVIFDATQSSDLDNDPLTFNWGLLSRPILSSAEIYLIQNNIAGLKTDAPGKYSVTLQINDGFESGEIVISQITATNNPPEIQCPEQPIPGSVGQPLTILLPEINDPEQDPITYSWEIISKPVESMIGLINSVEPAFTFTPDRKGTYEIQVIISDAWGGNTSCVITTEITNQRPVAVIQSETQSFINTPVSLSAESSYDPDGDVIKDYQWTIISKPQGSFAQLSNPTGVTTQLIPDKHGNYQVQLQIYDGNMWSNPAITTITTENRPPVITVIASEYLEIGASNVLDASLSYDPDGDELSFNWKLIDKPKQSKTELNSDNESICSFIPDYPGYYSIELLVSDPYSSVSRSEIVLRTFNLPPIAIISAPQIIKVGDEVVLDGTNSYDPDGDLITYQWQLSFRPNDSQTTLSSLTEPITQLYIDKAGTYTIELQVNDGKTTSDISTISLSTGNVAPTAVVEKDKNAVVGRPCYLDASASFDPNNDELVYIWTFISRPDGSQAEIFETNSPNPYFIPDVEGNYEIQLIISDGYLFSKPVVIRISTTNNPPVAQLKQDEFQVYVGDTVIIDGSDSYDIDNTSIYYEWILFSKPEDSKLTIQNADQPIITLNIDKKGFYQGTLVVNDGFLRSNIVNFQITCINHPPIAIIKGPETAFIGDTITLDGSDSYDSDMDVSELGYKWSIVSMPTGS